MEETLRGERLRKKERKSDGGEDNGRALSYEREDRECTGRKQETELR